MSRLYMRENRRLVFLVREMSVQGRRLIVSKFRDRGLQNRIYCGAGTYVSTVYTVKSIEKDRVGESRKLIYNTFL